jgi:glycosyltransferase involved in cell wall biosynthesis
MYDEWRDSADVIVGHRVSLPGPSGWWQQLAHEGCSKLVYDIDDNLFAVDPSCPRAHAFFSRPEIRDNIRANVAVSNLVTVSTEPLAEVMRAFNDNVTVLPNCVPSWVLDLATTNVADGLVTVGWAGYPSHVMDWARITSKVLQFITRNPSTELHLMGWAPPELWRRLPPGRRRFTGWIDSVPRLYAAIDFDIGVIPLQPHVFNDSKSAVKALELAALGVPCVASNVGPYAGFVRHGETGFLASRRHEWHRYLQQLLDPAVRKEMGAKARALAAKNTIERNAHLWEKALCT